MFTKEKSGDLKMITRSIDSLNLAEQLWLLEHIAHQIRIRNELATMSQDLQIQAELSQIQQEFAVTNFDSL